MVGWLNLIVPRLAGGICVMLLSACGLELLCEAVDPRCMKGTLHRIDQMIGVPLETSVRIRSGARFRDGLIYSERLVIKWAPGYVREMYYHGIEPDGNIIFSESGYPNFKRHQKDISRINERFLSRKRGRGSIVQIYIIDASPDTLRYELAVIAASKTKSFGYVQLRKCLNPSGQIRTKPPCWFRF